MKFRIAPDHPALPGHFPGDPIVPGVVLLEQVLLAIGERDAPPPGRLRLPRVKFLQPLLPGEAAEVALEELAPAAGGGRRWRFRVVRDEALLASGEVATG